MDKKQKSENKKSGFFKKQNDNPQEVVAEWQRNPALVAAVAASIKAKDQAVFEMDQTDDLLIVEPTVIIEK